MTQTTRLRCMRSRFALRNGPQRRCQPFPLGDEPLVFKLFRVKTRQLIGKGAGEAFSVWMFAQSLHRVEKDADRKQDVA